jgi:hypothetical protein
MARKLECIRWSIELAASEFGIDRKTLTKRLKANDEEASGDGKFSTAQMFKAIAGDLESERIGLISAQRIGQEIKNAESAGELVPTRKVLALCERIIIPIRQKIISSSLTEQERHDLLSDLVRLGDVDWAKEVKNVE